MFNLIAQIIGIFAMAMNVLSFQQKEQRKLIFMQLFGSLLFTTHFLMLSIAAGEFMMGCALNICGTVRGYVYSHKQQCRAEHPAWLVGFIAAYLAAYVLTFTVFGTTPTAANLIIEFLPVIAMTATTISFRMKDARSVRLLGFINSPAWLTYNLLRKSIGGALGEVFGLTSVIVGIIRIDLKKEKNHDHTNA